MLRALIIVVLLCAGGGIAHAQDFGAEPLSVSITPLYPRPYQTVTVKPSSTSFDLARAAVTVSVNGARIYSGTGGQQVNVTMGGPGTATTITVGMTVDGESYSKQLVVRPADVALIIEAPTTAHPFYPGGTPIAPEGQLRLVAFPDLRNASGRIAPENLVYTWKLGNQVLRAQSGVGKSVLTAQAPVRYRDTRVTLTVSTQDSAIVAQTSAIVSPIDPLVRIYENDPLLGPLFSHALSGTVSLAGDEQTYRAVPYFFGTAPALTWLVNSRPSGGERDITLRSTGSGAGSANLVLQARQPSTYQSADARLSITFNREGGLGIFGL